MNDMQTPERFEFHDWYVEKYGEEYPYPYTIMFKILAGREMTSERSKLADLVDEYHVDRKIQLPSYMLNRQEKGEEVD